MIKAGKLSESRWRGWERRKSGMTDSKRFDDEDRKAARRERSVLFWRNAIPHLGLAPKGLYQSCDAMRRKTDGRPGQPL